MTPDPISRRRLLAGAAGLGAASLGGGVAAGTRTSRSFIRTTRVRTDGVDGLVVDWRETYNGTTLTDGRADPSATGPALSLGNVLPGDSGSLSLRLRLEADEEDLAVTPELTAELLGEPRSPGLQEFLEATVWYDVGLLGIDAFGGRNAERDFGEPLVHPDAEGTIEEVGAALADGVVLDARPYVPGTSCLGVDDAVTITLGWSFPPNQPNVNAVQGDAIAFDLRFDVEQC